MEQRIPKSNQPIGRVKCVVDNCHFWSSGDHCVAQEIEIQAPGARNTDMTDCATFMPDNLA